MNTIIKLIITAVVAYLLPNVLSGVHVTTFSAAIILPIVLGLLNLFVKPILHLFSFPITLLTLDYLLWSLMPS